MSRIPEPDATPAGPSYQGRLLDRADEEVVDQGVSFDLRTLVSRRSILGIVGVGAGAVVLAACSTPPEPEPEPVAEPGSSVGVSPGATTAAAGEIPEETAGPYPGDGSNGPDLLEQSGIVRSDIRSSLDGGTTATGVPMALTLTILDLANGGAPFEGVAVYVWQCDSAGGYSLYSDGLENVTYLRGVQVADATGTVSFASIFPGCYPGRWPHIHFEVYPDIGSITDSTSAIATSQVALPQDVDETVYALDGYEGSTANLARITLRSDMVFGDDGGVSQLGTVTGNATSGYQVALTVPIDTRTVPSGA